MVLFVAGVLGLSMALPERSAVWVEPRRRCGDVRMLRARGTLRFGAVRGPSNWVAERDGTWTPGYWVEIEGGIDDGAYHLVQTANVSPGLISGAFCDVEIDETGRTRAVPADAIAKVSTSRSERDQAARTRFLSRLLQLPATLFAIATFAALLAASAPPPSERENLEQCSRLISGSVEIGDRAGAERWLSTCRLSDGAAEDLLAERWSQRWGDTTPPSMVQGVPERRERLEYDKFEVE